MPAQICTPVTSRWLDWAILMCDQTLSVAYRHGFVCNYPRSTIAHYRALVGAPSKGQWIRENVYKILPYREIVLPCPAAGCGQATACCPGNPVPSTLHGTNLQGSDGMGGMHPAQNVTFTYSPTGAPLTNGPSWGGSGAGLTALLWCDSTGAPVWTLRLTYSPFNLPTSVPDTVVCSPFHLKWLNTNTAVRGDITA